MLPLKDTLPGDRAPLLTLTLVVAVLAAALAVPGGGWDGTAGAVALLASFAYLWIFGATLEDGLGRPALLGLVALGAVAAFGAAAALGAEATVAAACTGAVSAVLGAYVVRHPRAGVLWASFVPAFMALVEVPVAAMVVLWAGVLVLAGAGGAVGAFVAGAAAARLLGGAVRHAPSPYRVA